MKIYITGKNFANRVKKHLENEAFLSKKQDADCVLNIDFNKENGCLIEYGPAYEKKIAFLALHVAMHLGIRTKSVLNPEMQNEICIKAFNPTQKYEKQLAKHPELLARAIKEWSKIG